MNATLAPSRPRSRRRPLIVAAGLALGALTLTSCQAADRATRMPPAARREATPPRIAEKAVKVGEKAPEITLPTSSGERWSLEGARQSGPAVLVFYRGDW